MRAYLQDLRRRLAREVGPTQPKPEGDLRVCLVYPNLYPVAMGNLGFQAIVEAMNQLPGVSCERATLPEAPHLRRLRRQGKGILSLESQKPLGEFDVLAFSVTYELDLLHLAEILEVSGIPADRTRRNRFHPVVLAGGAAVTVNHLPFLPLVDGVFRGEAEGRLEGLVELLRESQTHRGQPDSLRELFHGLAGSDPEDWGNFEFRVSRPRGSEALPFVPVGTRIFTEESVFGKTAGIEICRGCPWRCSFCIAKDMYGSFRKAAAEDVLAFADSVRDYTDRIGIVGAGLSAYPRLTELLRELRQRGFSCSLSSLRLDRVKPDLLDEIQAHGQRTLTVAPENFSDRLQGLVEKSLTLEKIIRGLERVGPDRFEKIKLYMIAGLPGQVESDHRIAFETAQDLIARGAVRPFQLEFSYSLLLPRPGTALGGAEVLSKADYKRTKKLLETLAREAKSGLKLESYRLAMVSDLLCRGGPSVGHLVLDWVAKTRGEDEFRLRDADYRREIAQVRSRDAARSPIAQAV